MRHHRVEKVAVAQARIVQSEFGIGRPLLAEDRPDGQPGPPYEVGQFRTCRRRFEIFDHFGRKAVMPDEGERVAGGSAIGVVVDDNAHFCRAAARRACAFGLADFDKAGAQRRFVEAGNGKRRESPDPVAEIAERAHESGLPGNLRPFDRGRVFDSPMRRHRLPRPDRAGFAGCVVADGEHEIHDRGVRPGKFVPCLRAQALGGIVEVRQRRDGERVHFALGLPSGRVGAEAARAILVQDAFGEDRAGGIAGAEEQDIENAFGCGVVRHGLCPWEEHNRRRARRQPGCRLRDALGSSRA